jgi:hypothetical protein
MSHPYNEEPRPPQPSTPAAPQAGSPYQPPPAYRPPSGNQPVPGSQPSYNAPAGYQAAPGYRPPPGYPAAPAYQSTEQYPSSNRGNAPSAGLPTESKGFFGSLFDFSFNSFVTPKIVKFVYVLATIIIAVGYVIFTIASFSKSAGLGVVVLLVGGLAALVYLAFVRMTLEFYYAITRMSEDINRRLPRA